MHIGQVVNFYHSDYGVRKDAVVREITGMGESNAKVLTLRFKDEDQELEIEGIYHGRDAEAGEPFWLLKGEKAPKEWAEAEPEEDLDIPVAEPVDEDEDVVPTRGPRKKRKR